MNFERLKAMVKKCSSDHGDDCDVKKSTFGRDGNEIIVVDVMKMCLVEMRGKSRDKLQ